MNRLSQTRLSMLHTEHLIHVPDDFEKALSGVQLVADFLTPKRLPTRVEQFQSSTWALDFQEAQVKARVHGLLPPRWVSIGLIRNAAFSSWYGCEVTKGTLLCNPPGEPIDGSITPGFSCLAVSFPADVWERAQQLAGGENVSFDRFAALQLTPDSYSRIEQRLLKLQNELRDAYSTANYQQEVMANATDFVMHIAASAWESATTKPRPPDSYRNRMRLAHRAENWLRDHLADQIQVTDLCLRLRISRRELEYAFKTAFDCGPQEYLNKLRLNAIYRVLRCSNQLSCSVSDIALDHGITHLGRFSSNYYRLFGEKPSTTLRKQATTIIR